MFRAVPKKKVTESNLAFWSPWRVLDKIFIFGILFLFSFSFITLFIRLFSLAVVKGDYYKRLSSQNRLREIIVEAPRGRLYDRKGYIIAESQIDEEQGKGFNRIRAKRIYLFPYASHFVGYVQEASRQEVKDSPCYYKPFLGDRVGRVGVEKILDCILRGKNGRKLVEVDAFGRKVREIAFYSPKKGFDLRLSLDVKLQEAAREAIFKRNLSNKKVAIVGLKPSTGEVLLYLSYPDFDPNDFENGSEKIKEYISSKDKPLFDRVAKGVYPPGSTFKPFVALAALEEKIVDERTLIEDTGVVQLGPQTFGNWYFLEYGKTDGLVDIVKAISRSNDIFFYKTGERLGEKKIRDWAITFGFSKLTGIGFDERSGIVPSDFWKRETIGSRWYLGDTYNLSIGQGYLLVTPLQLAVATAAIANDGNLCRPILLRPGLTKQLPFWAKEGVEKFSTPSCTKIKLSEKNLKIVKEGMLKACQSGGTAFPFFDFKVNVGCKTGTAESDRPSGLPHAWFTVFAPFEKPEIVLTVLVEEGGQGSEVAAPIARDILEFYFGRED